MLTYPQLAHIQQLLQHKLDYLFGRHMDYAEFARINQLEDMVWDMMQNYPVAHFDNQ